MQDREMSKMMPSRQTRVQLLAMGLSLAILLAGPIATWAWHHIA
jgi:hypothetical protein